MDIGKIGGFLAQLRKEKNLTQEQLGEKLGVTNKTVSRWENGNYLPPVEMLQLLSELYGISINELLSGQRLPEEEYREQAEENIKSALESGFSIQERLAFHKKAWIRRHWPMDLLILGLYLLLLILGIEQDGRELHLLSWVLFSGYILIRYNLMMAYAQRQVFDTSGESDEDKLDRIMKCIRVTALILLALCIWITVDLTLNYFSALVTEMNDGITVRGMWSMLFFGIDGFRWSILNYYKGFATSLRISGFVGILNIVLACMDIERIKGKARG